MKLKRALILIVLLLIATLSACNANNRAKTDGSGKVTVYTSFYIMYDFTLKIAGDRAEVINMVPAGTEPHDWEPSPKDITGLYNADLFIYSGCGMEGWVTKVLDSIRNADLITIEASRDIKHELIQHNGHDENGKQDHSFDENGYDPHVWLNPLYAKKQMEAIKDGLTGIDPDNRDFYRDNYEFYANKLDELDNAYRSAINEFSRKEIVVSHEAFGYLCNAYGLTQIAIEGISSESEPTPAKMAEIIDFVKENDVKVIFFEELASPKVAEAIARETGAKTALLNPIEGLSEENIKAGGDYFSIMEENLQALKEALR